MILRLIRPIGFGLLGLSLTAWVVAMQGLEWQACFDKELLASLLPLWLGYLLIFRGRELRLLLAWRWDTGVASAVPLAILRDFWRYLWQAMGVLILCSGVAMLAQPGDGLMRGHFAQHLVVAPLYLLVLKGLVFLPAELSLAKKSRERFEHP